MLLQEAQKLALDIWVTGSNRLLRNNKYRW